MIHPKKHVKRAIDLSRRVEHKIKTRVSVGKDYLFSVDSPRKVMQDKRLITVEGWIISLKSVDFTLRVINNEKIYPLKTGLKRTDVAKTHLNFPKEESLYSGYMADFEFEDGTITIEINEGKGFKKLYATTVQYGTEQLPSSIYNKDLSNNYPEHVNLLENRKKIYYEDAREGEYQRHPDDTRLVAIYLPQFHPFKENNEAWGEGFTEWTNVTAGEPRFVGHQQPILPSDLGFYDLRLESNIQAQIKLAKQHGVYGFCFYYYWFSGKKIMDTPLNTFMNHKEWDFNFTICWANENWTKRWDGRDSDVIIAQEYLEEDPLNFIKDVEAILLDPRYICEGDKPVLMVYRASELKEPKRYAAIWRDYFLKTHNRELQLVSYLSFDDQDPRDYGFDTALDFAPLSAFFKNELFPDNKFPYFDFSQKLLDSHFSGVVADYRAIALNDKLSKAFNFPVYPCVTPSWDNDARKKGKGFIYQNSSPDIYAHWLDRIVASEQQTKTEPLVFVNAWNEWAEGAIMEPSSHLGHAVLNRTTEVLSKYSKNKMNLKTFPQYGLAPAGNIKLAVVVHLYYVDLWPEIEAHLNLIEQPFDLFVTLNERDQDFKPTLNNGKHRVTSYILPNRGRDVLPFLFVAARLRPAGYEYILKLHSKKSKHRADGSTWFGDVLDNLLPSTLRINKVIKLLEKPDTGLIGPGGHLVSLQRHMGSNAGIIDHLVSKSYGSSTARKVIVEAQNYPYFGGTMFWCRVDLLTPILDLHLLPDDFQSEHGQVDGTTAHALERVLGVVAKLANRKFYAVTTNDLLQLETDGIVEKYKFAP